MKAITNWRYYVMAVMLTVGVFSLEITAGEDNLPLAEWFITHLGALGVAAGSFSLLGKLTKRWETNGEIPEFTNTKRAASDE